MPSSRVPIAVTKYYILVKKNVPYFDFFEIIHFLKNIIKKFLNELNFVKSYKNNN